MSISGAQDFSRNEGLQRRNHQACICSPECSSDKVEATQDYDVNKYGPQKEDFHQSVVTAQSPTKGPPWTGSGNCHAAGDESGAISGRSEWFTERKS